LGSGKTVEILRIARLMHVNSGNKHKGGEGKT